MGTLFTEIYCKNNILKDDNKLKLMSKPQQLLYLEKYLEFAIGEFEDACYKDLTRYTPTWSFNYIFVTDGIERSFLLDPIPPDDCLFYIGYRDLGSEDLYTEVTDFSYDTDTYEITLPCVPSKNIEFIVTTYKIGEFEEKLSLNEQTILAYGMLVPWDMQRIQKEELLTQKVYSNSVNSFSQANHIDSLVDVYKTVYYGVLKQKINAYSYAKDPDDLKGLTGGTDGYVGDTLWH